MKIIFCWRLEGHWRKEQDLEPGKAGSVSQWCGSEDPDPHQNVTDPEHRCEGFNLIAEPVHRAFF